MSPRHPRIEELDVDAIGPPDEDRFVWKVEDPLESTPTKDAQLCHPRASTPIPERPGEWILLQAKPAAKSALTGRQRGEVNRPGNWTFDRGSIPVISVRSVTMGMANPKFRMWM